MFKVIFITANSDTYTFECKDWDEVMYRMKKEDERAIALGEQLSCIVNHLHFTKGRVA